MRLQSITGWQEHICHGRQYLKTADRGLSRPTVFNNDLIYQLAAMAMEQLLVGLWQFHHRMPPDHTLTGLVEGLPPFCILENDLVEKIMQLDRWEDMCSLTAAWRPVPDESEVSELLCATRRLADFAALHTSTQQETESVD
jgi:hypothetical protein